MTDHEEYYVSPALIESTLAAARAARRRRRSAISGVSAMALATAAVASILFIPWKLLPAGGAANLAQTAAGQAASEMPSPAPTAPAAVAKTAEEELACITVALKGSGEGWPDTGISVMDIAPGRLDEVLGKYALAADPRDSQAAPQLESLRNGGGSLKLVLLTEGSGMLRLSAVGLFIEYGLGASDAGDGGRRVCFRFTDGYPDLYESGYLTSADAHLALLVQIPKQAAGLPFSGEYVSLGSLTEAQKLDVLVRRILTNAEAEKKLATAKVKDGEAAAEIYLQSSPMETGAILAMGEAAQNRLKDRYDALLSSGGGLPGEEDVLKLLLIKIEAENNPAAALRGKLLGQYDRQSIRSSFELDLVTRILELNGEEAGDSRVQVCAVYYAPAPAEGNEIAAAVLASVLDADGHASIPRLFIVKAFYENRGGADEPDWEMDRWEIDPAERLDEDDCAELQYSGADKALYALYGLLNEKMEDYIEKPFEPKLDNSGGVSVKLLDSEGTLRWLRLSMLVQREKGAGIDDIGIDAAGFPEANTRAARLASLSKRTWSKASESDYANALGQSHGVGLQCVVLEVDLLESDGLWDYTYRLDVVNKTIVLQRSLVSFDGKSGRMEYYICKEGSLYDSMISELNVNLDVSGLLTGQGPQFTLPPERDELKYLVALVQDMPGGIAAIRPSVLYASDSGELAEKALEPVTDKDAIAAWAKAVGKLLQDGAMEQVDAIPDQKGMMAAAQPGSPALLKWTLDVAAAKGEALLTLYANPATGQVWAELNYRLFGTENVTVRYMATKPGDKTLYLTLTKLTFGKEIENPADLPK
jgi:hypothetical protein